MANTSCKARAEILLACCLRGEPWPAELIPSLVADDCSDELFRIVAEGLADRFEPALCDAYARAFSEVIACCYPEVSAGVLLARYYTCTSSSQRAKKSEVGQAICLPTIVAPRMRRRKATNSLSAPLFGCGYIQL